MKDRMSTVNILPKMGRTSSVFVFKLGRTN